MGFVLPLCHSKTLIYSRKHLSVLALLPDTQLDEFLIWIPCIFTEFCVLLVFLQPSQLSPELKQWQLSYWESISLRNSMPAFLLLPSAAKRNDADSKFTMCPTCQEGTSVHWFCCFHHVFFYPEPWFKSPKIKSVVLQTWNFMGKLFHSSEKSGLTLVNT